MQHTLPKTLLSCFMVFILSACGENDNAYYGYVETRFIKVSSPNSGKITELAASRGQSVKKGDLLYSLEPQPLSDQLKQAANNVQAQQAILNNALKGKRPEEIDAIEAQIAAAKARISFSKKETARFQQLVNQGALSREIYDRAAKELAVDNAQLAQLQAKLATAKLPARIDQINAARANLASSQAQHEQIKWRMMNNKVYAPIDAVVFDYHFQLGERVSTNQAVLSLLNSKDVYAVFFIPERILSKVSIGQAILIDCNSCSDTLSATIHFISPQAEFTPPVIYSQSARSKLVYRIEATINDIEILKPGQAIDITISS